MNKCNECYHMDICYGENHTPICKSEDKERFLSYKDLYEEEWEED